MYEIINRNLNKKSDWDSYISYIKCVQNPNIDNINRYKLLRDYFCENEDVIKNKIEILSIEQIKEFGGCIMKPHINSMTLGIDKFKIEEIENSFKPYYTTTLLANSVTPSAVYDLETKLDGYYVLDPSDIDFAVDLILA